MKKSVSIGYTMQVDDYEPVKINVMHECDSIARGIGHRLNY